jgi:hypothetical protein
VRIADVYAMAAAAEEGAVFGQLRIRRYLFRRDVSVNPPGGTQPAIPRCITPRPWPPYLVARESGTAPLRPAKTRTTISTAEAAWQHWSR